MSKHRERLIGVEKFICEFYNPVMYANNVECVLSNENEVVAFDTLSDAKDWIFRQFNYPIVNGNRISMYVIRIFQIENTYIGSEIVHKKNFKDSIFGHEIYPMILHVDGDHNIVCTEEASLGIFGQLEKMTKEKLIEFIKRLIDSVAVYGEMAIKGEIQYEPFKDDSLKTLCASIITKLNNENLKEDSRLMAIWSLICEIDDSLGISCWFPPDFQPSTDLPKLDMEDLDKLDCMCLAYKLLQAIKTQHLDDSDEEDRDTRTPWYRLPSICKEYGVDLDDVNVFKVCDEMGYETTGIYNLGDDV